MVAACLIHCHCILSSGENAGLQCIVGMLDRERNQKMKAAPNYLFLQIGTALLWLMWCNVANNGQQMQPSKDGSPKLIHSNSFRRQSSDMPPPIAVEEALHSLCFIDYLIKCDQLWGNPNVWFVLILGLTLLSLNVVADEWVLIIRVPFLFL